METTISTNKKRTIEGLNYIGADFFNRLREESWTYIQTVVEVAREPILVLSKDLHVLAGNDAFYQTFQLNPRETENKIIYDIGSGGWNIESLRKLLEDTLPQQGFLKNLEVTHSFSKVGQKIMIVNARQIHFKRDTALEIFPALVLLAFEDVTDMMGVAEMLSRHTARFETDMKQRTKKFENRIDSLKKKLAFQKRK
jgi:hypothetical protein